MLNSRLSRTFETHWAGSTEGLFCKKSKEMIFMMQSNLHHLDLLKVSFICSFALLYRFWTYLNLTIIIYICPFSKSYNLRGTFSKNYWADVLAKTCEISLMRHLFRMEGLEFFENHKLSVITYFVLFYLFCSNCRNSYYLLFCKEQHSGCTRIKNIVHCAFSALLVPHVYSKCKISTEDSRYMYFVI